VHGEADKVRPLLHGQLHRLKSLLSSSPFTSCAQVTDCDASREFVDKVKGEVGAADATFKSFPGFYVRS